MKQYALGFTFHLLFQLLLPFSVFADSQKISPRIFGGSKSSKTKTVSLLVQSQSGSSLVYFCSGTFITTRHFMTAKHCLARNGFSNPKFTIFRSRGGAPIQVRRKRKSPNLDLAILTVPPVSVTPLPLLLSRTPIESEVVKIYGYGKDQNEKSALDSGTTHYLKVGNVTLTDVTSSFFSFINRSTGGLCHGDSGGPMVALDGNGDSGVVGVASFFRGRDACRAGNEGSYVNVQSEEAFNFILANAPEVTTN